MATGHTRACPIQVKMTSKSTKSLHFELVFRQRALDVLLFDGIVEKVSSSYSFHFVSKQFYYEVGSSRAIRIFFTSYSSQPFLLLAQFVSQANFRAYRGEAYLQKTWKEREENYYRFENEGDGSRVFLISVGELAKNCKNCLLTISVFLNSEASSHRATSLFDLEVSQQETMMQLG